MRLAIFDIDGTLTQTSDVDNECYLTAAAAALGVAESTIDWSDAPHITDSGILDWLFARHRQRPPTAVEIEHARDVLVRLLEERRAADQARFSPIPGAPDVFNRLRADGWTIAMATGCWTVSAHLKLTAAGIQFGDVPLVCSDDAPRRATLLTRAMERGSGGNIAALERVVSVGDGLWDVRAAVAVGVPLVGIGRGAHAERLRQAGATHVLPDLTDHAALRLALDQADIPWGGA